jgi:hypothetical protein
MDYSKRNYFVVWLNSIENSSSTPILVDKSRTITEKVSFKYSSFDEAFGILHEFWKAADPETRRPTDEEFISRCRGISKEVYDDTLENSLHEFSAEARANFGMLCSLNILFSAYEICPEIENVRKDLYADILNIFFSELKTEIADEELNRSLRVIEELYQEFSDIYKSRDHAIEIGKVVTFALSTRKFISNVRLYIENLDEKHGLSDNERSEFDHIINKPDIQTIGHQSLLFDINSLFSSSLDKEISLNENNIRQTENKRFIGCPLITPSHEPLFSSDWIHDLEKWEKENKRYKNAVRIVCVISLVAHIAASLIGMIKFKVNPFNWNLEEVGLFLMCLIFSTAIIALVPAVLCEFILKPKVKPRYF